MLIITINAGAVSAILDGDTAVNTPKHKPKAKHKAPIDAKVIYHARDSIRLDATTKKVFLYGDASVKYQDLELKAAYIDISMDSNIANSHGAQDSGKTVGKPEFHQGADVFYADIIRYNFKSKKGRINNIHTKEGEGFVTGKIVKKDSNGVFYMKNGTYTTCSETDPHFAINAVKLKVIPHDQVVTGPAWLVIEGVPTPLAIPFGFFPLQQGRHSGILIPAYGESQSQGFYFQNGGYYLGLSDNFDMQLRGDIYTYGSWALRDLIDYDDRYHYHGTFNLGYALTKLPIDGTTNTSQQRTFNISWNDQQDSKARPNSTFMASVNAGSSNYFTNTSYNPSTFLTNTLSSNISFTQNFPQTPFHLTLSADHSQNTINHSINIDLPVMTFAVDRIYPAKWFESEDAPQNPNKWYNNVSFTVNTSAENKISTVDSLLLKPNTLKQMQNGLTTTIPLSGNFRIFRYFTLTPTISINSTEYLQTIHKRASGDSLITDTVQGLKTANTYNASATINTSVYSLYSLGIHHAVTIRHVLYPTLGFSYQPDFSDAKYGYWQTPDGETNNALNTKYSIFQNGIYGGPGQGKQENINMSLGNNLEMKIRHHTDSGVVYKKVKLIERFTISTSYNVAADSDKLSYFSLTGNTTLFKKLAVNYSGSFNPYKMDADGANSNQLLFGNGKWGRFTNNTITLSTTLTQGAAKPAQTQGQQGQQNQSTQDKDNSTALHFTSPDDYFQYIANRPAYYAPLELNAWSVTLNYSLSSAFNPGPNNNINTQGLMVNMSAQVTKYWHAGIYTGYDFTGHQFTSTSISATRDLHCWEFVFNTIPFGFHQNFSVEVHVKSSVLKDLKLTRKRDWEDTQQYQTY
ncbi:MAG TPA: putative LPS assembly protein LptD [Bacteroidia bacterium]|nr:putative LPS assembly protein LptD [Bacteroidia bacterium]